MTQATHDGILLVDNGSVLPYAPLYTRKVAQQLESYLNVPCQAVSLDHSDRIPIGRLNHDPVLLLADYLPKWLQTHSGKCVILPFMLATGGAIYRKMEQTIKPIAHAHGEERLRIAKAIVSIDDQPEHPIVDVFERQIRSYLTQSSLDRPRVILVDHGSPRRESAELRNQIATQLDQRLTDTADQVVPASMERREGEAYDFNEPLLETALREADASGAHQVILARLFLQPGKHSGKGGDIDQICRRVEDQSERLKVHSMSRIFSYKYLIPLLIRRYHEVSVKNSTIHLNPDPGPCDQTTNPVT